MFFINPFIYGGAGGDFESIATVTVGSGGAANIEFTSIPGTYQHLQLRAVVRGTGGIIATNLLCRLNGDTGNNYAFHVLSGNGTSASASATASTNTITLGGIPAANADANLFGVLVMDILDYASTSKKTTVRVFEGSDRNGSGTVSLRSGLLDSTSALTSVRIYTGSNMAQYSTAALYGIKAP